MDEVAVDRLQAALARPLASLALPTRLASFAERRGLRSIGDLARLSPEELLLERNLGRNSVYDAGRAIDSALGVKWEDVRDELLRVEPDRGAREAASSSTRRGAGGNAARWASCGVRFAAIESTPLVEFGFPARVGTFARARGLKTIGDLLAVDLEDFATAKNVGRGTVATTLVMLEAAAAERVGPEPSDSATDDVGMEGPAPDLQPSIPEGARWVSLLRDALSQLGGKERIIATQRCGLAGAVPTLQELGECFGVSRERIRQLETRALERLRRRLPCAEATRRLAEACEVLVSEPEAVAARDAFFAFDAEEVPGLVAFVNEILAADVHALVLNERLVFSRATQPVLIAHLRRARTLVEAATFPVEEEDLARGVAAALDVGVEDARALFGYLAEPVLRSGTRIVGFGRTREDAILAALRAAEGPLTCAAIEEQHGRGRIPAEAVFVDRGLVSVPEKIQGWERWLRRLPPVTRRVIEREGPERQWSTAELVDVLATECDLPEWLNAWTLGSLLRRSTEVAYLGRNVVALCSVDDGEEDGESKRTHLAPALEEILRSHGEPMPDGAARAALERVRGVHDTTWAMLRVRRPFLLLDGGTVGLYPRDVPGGTGRATRVLAALYAWLDAEQVGLPAPAVAPFLEELGEEAHGISQRMLRSLARIDGRFRLSVAGAIGLAEWDGVRVLTQGEQLETLLEEAGGAVPVEVVCARILTSAGEPLPRPQLANLAQSVGARVAGELVVRRAPVGAAPRSALLARVAAELPERTVDVFERLLDEVHDDASAPDAGGLQADLAAWAAALRARAATDCPHIEVDQLDAIAQRARGLAEQLVQLEGDARALANAAVRYVLCTDDAETDLAVGGLDDDEAVLARVTAAIGVPSSTLAEEEPLRS